jgi:hypothetical protein
MRADPVSEWQRLIEHYREMGDEELRELAADFVDLTEPAQRALSQEMRSRGLGDPKAPQAMPQSNVPAVPATIRIEPEPGPDNPAIPFGGHSRMPQIVPDEPDADAGDDDGPREYTWKTVLCDCDTNEQAKELSAALQQAGLDSWIQQPMEFGRRFARVLVAADQLEQARSVAARPITQQAADEPNEDVPEFEPPKCPKCGAEEPVLEGVDPTNTWRCEQCGEEWSDSAEAVDEAASKTGRMPSENGKSRPATGQLSPQGE